MTIRLGVIGLGMIAERGYFPVLMGLEGVELFLHSRTEARVKKIRDQYRVPNGSTNVEDLLKWGPDAVFVLTPSPAHYPMVKNLLELGLDIFLEKPATSHSSQTRELAELAEKKNKILMLAFNRRFSPLNIKAREMWGDRGVGFASFEKHRSKPNNPDLSTHLIDEVIHVIDLVRFFCGEARAVKTISKVRDGYLVEASSLLELEKGGFATVSCCMDAGHWYERCALHGDQASMYVDVFSQVRLVDPAKDQTIKVPYDSTWDSNLQWRGFVGEVANFLECINTRNQPVTTAWECMKTQELVEDMVLKADLPGGFNPYTHFTG